MSPYLYSSISALVVISLASMASIFSYQSNKSVFTRLGLLLTIMAAFTLSGEVVRSFVSHGNIVSTAPVLLASVLCVMTVIGQTLFKMRLAGLFTLPISMLLLLLDLFKEPARFHSADAPFSFFRDMHIGSAILGEAMAIGAFSISLMYLWQHMNLKKKAITQLSDKVPALDKLSSLLNITLWLGLIFLTIALISGAYYTSRSVVSTGIGAKVLWAISVWIWYMGVLILKNVLKKPTTYVAKLSLIGFFILAISIFGILLKPSIGI